MGEVLLTAELATPEAAGLQWADLVVESFRAEDVAAWARSRSIPLEALAAARARFLAAGRQALSGTDSQVRWFQVETALEADPDGAGMLAQGFTRQLEEWLAKGSVRHFSFLHKPPGLRLRFFSDLPAFDEQLRASMERWSAGAWNFSFYEPEQYLFGGPAGLDLAHGYFTIESIAVLKYRDCVRMGCARLSPYEFSLLILHALFGNLTADSWELWDLWCNMRLTGRLTADDLVAPEDREALRADLLPLLFDAETAARKMSSSEEALWEWYQEKVKLLIPRIRQCGGSGALLWPLRQTVPFWAVFHWNRMGFGIETQRRLARAMTTALSPKW